MVVTNETAIVAIPQTGLTLNNSAQQTAARKSQESAGAVVPHIGQGDVLRMMEAIAGTRNGQRDALLISVLFDSCLRVSETLTIRLCDLGTASVNDVVNLKHHGQHSAVALSHSRVLELKAYVLDHRIRSDERIFAFTRTRVFQIVSRAMQLAGIIKPAHVGAVHVLRHSGALERLRRSGNAREIQEQLRHSQTAMTLRYLRTLTHEESVKSQGAIELWQ